MRLEILEFPDARLTMVSKPVTHFDRDLHQLLDNMAETMHASKGIGLAAPQVDRPVRAFVIDLGLQEGYPKQHHEFINPKLVAGMGRVVFEEGCLSVPGVGESVARHRRVTVWYQDRFGAERKLQTEGLLAVAVQHEYDHLEGILFVDRLPILKRHWLKRKLTKRVTL